jgi:HAD superfamily hydrolase (TIGR01484 family)
MGSAAHTPVRFAALWTPSLIAVIPQHSTDGIGQLMRYLVLASDYDGTLAHDGRVDPNTLNAIERLRQSGRKFILVTGRELPDLKSVFPHLDLCDRIVAENGALVYNPATRECKRLAERPPDVFIQDLQRRGVKELSVGAVIVATWRPHEHQVIEAIRDSGLELQIIFNKDAVMILPAGVNKMTGLCAALDDMRLSRHNVVAIGDAENDNAFLDGCECSVAVANALPTLKQKATLVTVGARGAGVTELVERLLGNDLSDVDTSPRTSILVGTLDETQIVLPAYGSNLLVCGQSGSGKSNFVIGLVERLMDKKYQLCVIDPEGDYDGLEGCRTIGDENRPPSVHELMQVLIEPSSSAMVNFVAVPARDRPDWFTSFLTSILDLRLRLGRPHWLIIDEAHHMLPSEWAHASSGLTEQLTNLVLITVHPEHTSRGALRQMGTVAIIGRQPKALLNDFARAVEAPLPDIAERDLEPGETVLWFRKRGELLFGVQTEPPRTEHHRHKRKYAEGQLEEDRMFRFRGPEGKMNLAARNLTTFVQLAEGVDSETWLFHLRRKDYSTWFRGALKDTDIADEIEAVEGDTNITDAASRQRIKEIILSKYTAPA